MKMDEHVGFSSLIQNLTFCGSKIQLDGSWSNVGRAVGTLDC